MHIFFYDDTIVNMKIINKYINREYAIIETYEAGIVLIGVEVKSVRKGNMQLKNSYIKLMHDGAVLLNAEIPVYHYTRQDTYDSRRTRKLLLHKAELIRLKTKLAQKPAQLTIVPIACYTTDNLIKLEIGLAKGRKTWERRKVEKDRDVKRQTKKEIKEYIKR